MYTIKDIAKLANVSQSTVSKALNDRHDISQKTKDKILKIAKQHNFTPHNISKLNIKTMTENIGVVFCREERPLSGNPFYSRILEGIEGELVLNNYNLILHLLQEQVNGSIPKMIKDRKIDGLILIGIMTKEFMEMMRNVDIPIMHVDPAAEYTEFNKVTIDNERGAFLATQHLISKGHKDIAFISGVLERSSFSCRFNGFKKAMNLHNISVKDEYVMAEGVEKGYEQVCEILKLKKRPTAIFFSNDENALYGYKAINDFGLKIPEDISIVGFDDISMSKYSSPPLTTVRVYKEEIGSVAVRNLLPLIKNKPVSPLHVLVPTRFIERESVKDIR